MEAQDEQAQEAEKVGLLLERQRRITRAIKRGRGDLHGQNVSTSGVNIHSDGLVAVIVALVGIGAAAFAAFCLVVAVAAVLVVAAWRDADMTQLEPIKADTDQATARVEQHERRLLKLENPPQ